MKKYFKSMVCCLLIASMVLSNISAAFAEQLTEDGAEVYAPAQINNEDEFPNDNPDESIVENPDDSHRESNNVQEEKSTNNPTEEVSIIDFSATEYSFEEGNNIVNVTLGLPS